jgi:uncharacterized protein (TIGR02646 family)
MRHLSPGTEPPGLRQFREQQPDATWKQFGENATDAYKELQNLFKKLQGGICAYCEIELLDTDFQVEHFHPKSDKTTSHNWHLDFDNLLACCKGGHEPYHLKIGHYLKPPKENYSCGHKKGDKILDGVILHPREVPETPLIWTIDFETGVIQPNQDNCRLAKISVDKVKRTIEELGLNCPRLCNNRRAVLEVLDKEREFITQHPDELVNVVAGWLSPRKEGTWHQFFTTIRWYFGSAAEQFLFP